jgi:hypothetical protein
MMPSSVNRVSRLTAGPGIRPLTWGNIVSEGGLGPRPWWYIPEPGIYHHSKLTRKGRPGPQSAGGKKRQHQPSPTSPRM